MSMAGEKNVESCGTTSLREIKHFKLGNWVALTLIPADGYYRATELQTFIPIWVHAPCSTLNSGTSLEVNWVQSDELGGSEEGIKINFSHRAGDTIVAGGGTDEPTIMS